MITKLCCVEEVSFAVADDSDAAEGAEGAVGAAGADGADCSAGSAGSEGSDMTTLPDSIADLFVFVSKENAHQLLKG